MAAAQSRSRAALLRDAIRAYARGRASAAGAPAAPGRPEIVCLLGSSRFGPAFRAVNREQTLSGKIVLTIGVEADSDGNAGISPAQKEALDELQLRKVDLADGILVLNVGGHIGSSTRRAIAYAEAQRKPVDYLEG